jgi:hypothetical protein
MHGLEPLIIQPVAQRYTTDLSRLHLGPNILLSTLISDTVNLYSSTG